MSERRGLGFRLIAKSLSDQGCRITVAEFICRDCPEILNIPVNGKPLPEMLAKKARDRGWEANADRFGRTRCPRCQTIRRLDRQCGQDQRHRTAGEAGYHSDAPQRPLLESVF